MSEEKHCYFCRILVDADDHCFGCGEYVCSKCDKTEPMGKHSVEAHRGEHKEKP